MITMLLLMVAGCGDDRTERLPGDDMVRVFPQVYDLSDPDRPGYVLVEFAPFSDTGAPYEDGTGAFWLSAEAKGALSNDDGSGISVSFDFEDGVAECWYIPSNANEDVTVYAAAGAFPYDIVASARIYVRNQVLDANFSYEKTGLTAYFFNLSVPNSGVNPALLAYSWDFESDGTIDSVAENPNHTYAAAGTYRVTLTVTEGAQTDSVYANVVVEAP
jgi:PKD repeat protein